MSVLVASVWLVASVAAGIWLFVGASSDPVRLSATRPYLTPDSVHIAYGGDAYTGIQNAASDTEHAVVDATNGMVAFSQDLAESSAGFNRGLANRVEQGLAVLIVGVGLLNFTVAMSRSI
jgi:hypothetical protein